MHLREFAKAAAPSVVHEIIQAHKTLTGLPISVSTHPWFSAFSPGMRRAIAGSRFALFPRWLRRPLSFVLDVGANEGQWLTSLLVLVPVKEAWVFEPNPDAMQRCRMRAAQYPGITFHEVAVGAVLGRAVLHVTQSSDFSSLLIPNTTLIEAHYSNNPAKIIAEQMVEVTTLDKIVPLSKEIDLLKIDVQGVEREVLQGASLTLKRTAAILLEVNLRSHYDGDQTFGSLYSVLEARGFELWSMSQPYLGTSGEALWADALFVNRSHTLRRGSQ